MSVTKLDSMSTRQAASPFLYQTQLGGIATVSVTHNAGCLADRYAGNLGLHVNDDSAAVLARRLVLESNLRRPIQWLNQVHGNAVYQAQSSSAPSSMTPTADAAVTQDTGIALAIMTADCLPVMLSASNAQGLRAIGAAHAGWRGLLGGVLANTVHTLEAMVPNASLQAHLGPCIGVGQFEVGGQVRDAFVQHNASANKHFTPLSADKYLCDLESLGRDALAKLGVQAISGGGWCTVSDSRLASYRRQAMTGRFATAMMLNPPNV